MGSQKEHARLFPVNKIDNMEFTVPTSGTAVTFNFVDGGTNTAITKYYNLGNNGAYHFSIRPSATVLVNKINGKTLTDPITVTTAGYIETHIQVLNMEIETTADSLNIKLLAKGGK